MSDALVVLSFTVLYWMFGLYACYWHATPRLSKQTQKQHKLINKGDGLRKSGMKK